jgi:hypothetical protein
VETGAVPTSNVSRPASSDQAPQAINEAPSPTPAVPSTPTATGTAPAVGASSPAKTPTPQPTNNSIPTPTFVPRVETSGWDIAGMRFTTDQYPDRVVLYGDLINKTDASQEVSSITGTFYDSHDQVIADADDIADNWPIDVIPAGGHMPFELIVKEVQGVANLSLRVEAEPSNAAQRQDFEFLDVSQSTVETGDYCVAGNARNPGEILEHYMVVTAILFDSLDNVINFAVDGGPPPSMSDAEELSFEICQQTFNQEVARFELRAWGR